MNKSLSIPEKILVWGGCATRDAFPDHRVVNYKIGYIARSSMAALNSCGTRAFDAAITASNMDNFEKRAALRDCSAAWNLEQELAESDIFIVDLLSERKGVAAGPNGELVSRSWLIRELMEKRPELFEGYIPESGNEGGGFGGLFGKKTGKSRYMQLFEEGVTHLAKILDNLGERRPKVVVNEVYFAHMYDNGTRGEVWATSFNKHLAQLYPLFSEIVKPDLSVRYPKSELVGRKIGHRWDPAPFHFTVGYYERLPKAIWNELGYITNQTFA